MGFADTCVDRDVKLDHVARVKHRAAAVLIQHSFEIGQIALILAPKNGFSVFRIAPKHHTNHKFIQPNLSPNPTNPTTEIDTAYFAF